MSSLSLSLSWRSASLASDKRPTVARRRCRVGQDLAPNTAATPQQHQPKTDQHFYLLHDTNRRSKEMIKLVLSLLSLSAVNAATRIAVIEAGVGGTVHRTTSTTPETSVDGAASFLQAMHGRKIQHAGMTVVPDLFKKADSGIVIGVSAVDFAELPLVSGLYEDEGKNGVIGHLEINGSRSDALLSKVAGEWKDIEEVKEAAEVADKSGLSAVKISLDNSKVAAFDSSVHGLIADVDAKAKEDGKTVVIYLVLEEDEAAARRRAVSSPGQVANRRRLDEADQYQQNQYNNANKGNFFHGYGYFNDYGEWVTPYKTMFQIQYFNVVLWTSVGLTIVLCFTIYLMMFMPLEPDTLLFGESAKMVGDD